jgi:hypothetical protein
MRRAPAAAALLAALLACGRVPETALRDEQSRSRRYRDAYETQLGENGELRKRLTAAEQRARACPAGAEPPSQPPPPSTPSTPQPAAPLTQAPERSP